MSVLPTFLAFVLNTLNAAFGDTANKNISRPKADDFHEQLGWEILAYMYDAIVVDDNGIVHVC